MPRKNVSVAKNDLRAIPTPEPTDTWMPIPHYNVVWTVDDQLEKAGIGVRSTSITVNANGSQMFSSYILDLAVEKEARLQFGFRNAHDKRFALGCVGGLSIIVCSNLQFNGEFIDLRKHTSGLTMEEMAAFIALAIEKIRKQGHRQWDWQKTLRQINMAESDLKTFAYDCMDQGAFAPSQFFGYQEALEEEIKIGDGVTLYQAHGAVTRLHRKASPPAIARMSPVLKKVCDDTRTNRLSLL